MLECSKTEPTIETLLQTMLTVLPFELNIFCVYKNFEKSCLKTTGLIDLLKFFINAIVAQII